MIVHFRDVMKNILGSIVCCCLVTPFITQAATSATTNVTVMVDNPRPTCNVRVKSTHDLDTLPSGTYTHGGFPVQISCTGSIKTALVAKNLSGSLQNDNYRILVPMGKVGSGNGPYLWLLDNNGNTIKLRGAEGDAFCISSEQHKSCNVRPVTQNNVDSGWGDGSVTIRFDLVYPA